MSTIGAPKETTNHEYRVAITPAGVEALKSAGHYVLIERGAGEGTGISDEDYVRAGAEMVSASRVFSECEIIAKVKEPLQGEYGRFHQGQVLFTYFHFAANRT